MARSSIGRFRHVLWMTALLAAPSWPLAASEPEPKAPASLAELVRAGDTVTVTFWSRERISGAVIETTQCSLVLRDANRSRTVTFPAIKTLRRHDRRTLNRGTRLMLEISSQCDQGECLPAAFAFFGIGAAIQGFDNLAHPPKVVYRAKQRRARVGSCTEEFPR